MVFDDINIESVDDHDYLYYLNKFGLDFVAYYINNVKGEYDEYLKRVRGLYVKFGKDLEKYYCIIEDYRYEMKELMECYIKLDKVMLMDLLGFDEFIEVFSSYILHDILREKKLPDYMYYLARNHPKNQHYATFVGGNTRLIALNIFLNTISKTGTDDYDMELHHKVHDILNQYSIEETTLDAVDIHELTEDIDKFYKKNEVS